MANGPDNYDPRAALYAFAPGVLLTRDIEQSLIDRCAATGQPLTADDVVAITGPLPAPVNSIPYMRPGSF